MLEAAWPQIEAAMQQAPSAGAAAGDGTPPPPAGVAVAAGASAAALALSGAAAAALPELQGRAKRPRLPAAPHAARAHDGKRLAAMLDAVRAVAPQLQVELMNSFANTRPHHPWQADEVRAPR